MDFVSWLEALPAATVGKLYGSQWACQAVLRSLPPLAKQYVVRMLFVEIPIPSRLIQLWATSAAASKHLAALERLKRLQLLVASTLEDKEQGFSLHPVFQQQLQGAVTSRAGAADDAAERPDASDMPSRQQLSSYAQEQWETMLLYLVGSVERLPAGSPLLKGNRLPVDSILEGAGLMTGQKKDRKISEAGYQFLLLDTYSQLWRLLREYIASGEEVSGAPLGAILNFLLQLGFREVGSAFRLESLSRVERTIASDIVQLGLLMPFMSGGSVWVAPTRLALALAGGGAGHAQQDAGEGFIVVETNYRVYAYTASQLQTAILRLFTRCECILPNLFVGVLTRESTVGALACGLSADQIVGYLRQHAHPHVASRSPVVPEVVADQVRLWQADTQRVRNDRAVLYDDFPSKDVFGKSCARARELGAWLWEDAKAGNGRLAVLESGHDKMREYIRSIK